MSDAKDYVTNPAWVMYWIDDPDHPPPMNKTILLTNEGKVLDKGKLTADNITHFLHWMEMPVIPKTKPWLEKNANLPRVVPETLGRGEVVRDRDDLQASSKPTGHIAGNGENVHQADQATNESTQSIAVLDALLSIPVGGNEA